MKTWITLPEIESRTASAMDLAGCIFPEGRKGPLMFLKVYADESADAATFCCGAVFGWPKDFYYLGLKWEDRLKQDNLTYFHAFDCEHLCREFKALTRVEADSVRRDLTNIIRGEPVVGISLGVVKRDFKSLVTTNSYAKKYFGTDIMIASYKLLIKTAVELMENDWREEQYANLKIGFVFDSHSNWKKAEGAYERLRVENAACAKRMLVASHADDKDYAGLQMADLMAYECRIETNKWMKDSVQEREAMKSLKKSHNIYFMGFMGKAELISEMNRSKL
jgi:hypothetical protein